MGSMLLSREGLLREKGQLPAWVTRVRGWRWSYYFAKRDARRRWITMDDLTRTPWMVRGANEPSESRKRDRNAKTCRLESRLEST